MAPLILVLVYFLGQVYGAAYPDPTPAAELGKRQFLGMTTIWSPTLSGTTLSYAAYSYGGTATVTTSAGYWNWCDISASLCYVASTCQGGTLYYQSPSTTILCASTNPVCGEDYLYSTDGATGGLTRYACYSTASQNSRTFFLTSPPGGSNPTTTPPSSTSSTSTTPAQSSSSSHHSPAPIGAIVGGVIGGIAVIGLAALGILFLLFRRKRKYQQAPQSEPQAGVPFDNKHASYAGSTAYTGHSPPLPNYQTPGNPNQGGYYAPYPPQQQPDGSGYNQAGWPAQPAHSPYPQPYGAPQVPQAPLEMEATHSPKEAPGN